MTFLFEAVNYILKECISSKTLKKNLLCHMTIIKGRNDSSTWAPSSPVMAGFSDKFSSSFKP